MTLHCTVVNLRQKLLKVDKCLLKVDKCLLKVDKFYDPQIYWFIFIYRTYTYKSYKNPWCLNDFLKVMNEWTTLTSVDFGWVKGTIMCGQGKHMLIGRLILFTDY